ncbi:uncharacterized protein DUF998 [Stackebrandtia albiflava]|uniref:Uncharacterized protein DUF998 n=1 Tax=Stackebrandtia albiflava TaxID=406432 RepID=A0A562UQ00_9ACTN|nr:DUF998 domain-containing protein [Stackebrandtia albiflava]TWJ07695.1 uncharacterized protein DUF998 [Stackebrandtia albiflava]
MTAPQPAAPWQTVVAAVGGAAAAVGFLLLHLVMADSVDPMVQPVSSYALRAPGSILFPLGTLGLAAGCAALAAAGLGLPRQRPVRALLGLAAVLLVLVVVFRTDTGDTVTSTAGEIHRWSAGAAFGALLLAGLAADRAMRYTTVDPFLRRLSRVLAGLSLVALALTALNTFLPEFADGASWRGLPQRILLAVETGLVLLLARLPMAAEPPPRPLSWLPEATPDARPVAVAPRVPVRS